MSYLLFEFLENFSETKIPSNVETICEIKELVFIYNHIVSTILSSVTFHILYTCLLLSVKSLSHCIQHYNRLNAHMHRKLKIVPSPTCPCGEEDQITEHVLQICNRHQPERIAQWPSAIPLHQKLYGDLKKTTNFITAAGLVV